jgi:hypothetical protein
MDKAFISRFWSRVDKSGGHGACWPYTGCRNGNGGDDGYGLVRVGKKRMVAHRVAWTLEHGALPSQPFNTCDKLLVLHRCDNPPCCNPEHLFVGTHKDNAQDKISKGRAYVQPRKERPPPRTGPTRARRKLSDDQVRTIRALSAMGPTKLGATFGVNAGTIWNLLNGRSYKHVSS